MFLNLSLISILVFFCHASAQDVVQNVKLDNKEVRCLVCEASIQELTAAVKNSDKTQTVKVGGHRLDSQGNYDAPKTVPLAQSEIYLSELMEAICNKMDDYVRGLWKANGTLTILKMVSSEGKMNPHMGEIEFVQDDDLNKSLKYYCESIVEEFEENIIKYYQNKEDNIDTKFCIEESKLCPPRKKQLPQKEL